MTLTRVLNTYTVLHAFRRLMMSDENLANLQPEGHSLSRVYARPAVLLTSELANSHVSSPSRCATQPCGADDALAAERGTVCLIGTTFERVDIARRVASVHDMRGQHVLNRAGLRNTCIIMCRYVQHYIVHDEEYGTL